jgi:hypothetical protein
MAAPQRLYCKPTYYFPAGMRPEDFGTQRIWAVFEGAEPGIHCDL